MGSLMGQNCVSQEWREEGLPRVLELARMRPPPRLAPTLSSPAPQHVSAPSPGVYGQGFARWGVGELPEGATTWRELLIGVGRCSGKGGGGQQGGSSLVRGR